MSLDPRLNPAALVAILTTAIGLLAALFIGGLVANNDFRLLGAIFGAGFGLIVFLALGRQLWLVIPLCWPLTGKISILPIPLNVQEIAVTVATGYYLALIIFKKSLHHPKNGWLELLLAVNLVWIAIVWFRNPVGVGALGTDMLGGRPYFEILVACAAYFVLTRTLITPKQVRYFPILMGAGSILVSGLGILTTLFPRLTPFIAPFYSGVDTQAYQQEVLLGGRAGEDSVGRLTTLRSYGTTMIGVVFALFRPLSLLNPVRFVPFLIFLSAIAAIFLSGFRSALIGTGIGFIMTSYFWGGTRDAVKAIFIAIVGILILISLQSTGISLPKSAQRALSVIPIEWDADAIRDAQGTSDWRWDMWVTVLENRDKYLKNPILGSGFGFPARDLEIQLNKYFGGTGYIGGAEFETQLITGAFHNGPLSTIRFAGVIGLVFYYALSIAIAIYAFRLIKTTKGSPYFYLAVFIGTPAIYGLFSFTFIYGAFDSALQGALFSCAMIRCTSESHRMWSNNLRISEAGDASTKSDISAVSQPASNLPTSKP